MDFQTLEKGKKIAEQMKDLGRVLDHFMKIDEAQLPQYISNYLISCNNVGNSAIRADIAKNMLDCTRQFLNRQIEELGKEFAKL